MGQSKGLSLVLAVSLLVLSAQAKNCTLKLRNELRIDHPVPLDHLTNEYLYPTGKKDIPVGEIGLRVACPTGDLVIHKFFGNDVPTNRSVADLECDASGKFKFAGDNATGLVFQLKNLRCSNTTVSSKSRPLESTSGLAIAEIGLELQFNVTTNATTNATEPLFVPSIGQVADGMTQGQSVRWSRVRVIPLIMNAEVSKLVPEYKMGVFDEGVDMRDVYNRTEQRTSFMQMFNDTALVDKYLPVMGDNYFSQGQLIQSRDLYWTAQQDATYSYDNVVPIWESIGKTGNWKLTSDLLRSFASQSTSGLDIWAGAYQQLAIDDTVYGIKFVNLTHGVQPPMFLFRYVHDESTNRGLVFVTVNNPHLERITTRDIICDKYSSCDLLYPEFVNRTRGFTYCCKLEDFRFQATMFGLPLFPGASPLI